MGPAVTARIIGAIVARPQLWGTVVRLGLEAAPAGWWRRAPYLPIPERAFVELRLSTAYGASGRPRSSEVVEYLEWVRATRRRAC